MAKHTPRVHRGLTQWEEESIWLPHGSNGKPACKGWRLWPRKEEPRYRVRAVSNDLPWYYYFLTGGIRSAPQVCLAGSGSGRNGDGPHVRWRRRRLVDLNTAEDDGILGVEWETAEPEPEHLRWRRQRYMDYTPCDKAYYPPSYQSKSAPIYIHGGPSGGGFNIVGGPNIIQMPHARGNSQIRDHVISSPLDPNPAPTPNPSLAPGEASSRGSNREYIWRFPTGFVPNPRSYASIDHVSFPSVWEGSSASDAEPSSPTEFSFNSGMATVGAW